jgi:acyl carrier protein
MLTREEIHRRVCLTLAQSLDLVDDDLSPDAKLERDLGAESIDFLDINFRLEREFGIDIPQDELFPESVFQGKTEFVQNGRVTAKGMVELRSRLPFADLDEFEKNPKVDHIADLFTVGAVARYIRGKLNGRSNGHAKIANVSQLASGAGRQAKAGEENH